MTGELPEALPPCHRIYSVGAWGPVTTAQAVRGLLNHVFFPNLDLNCHEVLMILHPGFPRDLPSPLPPEVLQTASTFVSLAPPSFPYIAQVCLPKPPGASSSEGLPLPLGEVRVSCPCAPASLASLLTACLPRSPALLLIPSPYHAPLSYGSSHHQGPVAYYWAVSCCIFVL